VNDALVSNPNLLKLKPGTDGFIAIIQPSRSDELVIKNGISLEEYSRLRNAT